MRTDHREISQLLSRLQILDDLLLPEQVHSIGHVIRQRDSVGSVCVIQDGDADTVLLIDIDLLAVIRAAVDTEDRFFRIMFLPESKAV